MLKYSELSYFMALYKVKVLLQGFTRERTESKETDFAIFPLLKLKKEIGECHVSVQLFLNYTAVSVKAYLLIVSVLNHIHIMRSFSCIYYNRLKGFYIYFDNIVDLQWRSPSIFV